MSFSLNALEFEQVDRLVGLLNKQLPLHGQGNFPTLEVTLKDMVRAVKASLKESNVELRDVRLNGSAASYVVADTQPDTYNDVDLIFGVALGEVDSFKRVKEAVGESLLKLLPTKVSKARLRPNMMVDAYVNKMVKVCQSHDCWSLMSLHNDAGCNVELKFVDKMHRQFEFSVDSFQIYLDPLLYYEEHSNVPMSRSFYPTVFGVSLYGDFEEAMGHLKNHLIDTDQPEEIRGGGLLKYCRLLASGYKPAHPAKLARMERYMCSRFFIDFPDIQKQGGVIDKYLTGHCGSDARARYAYLMVLHRVIEQSTVCLMSHERRQTLRFVTQAACACLRQASKSTKPSTQGQYKQNQCEGQYKSDCVREGQYKAQCAPSYTQFKSCFSPHAQPFVPRPV